MSVLDQPTVARMAKPNQGLPEASSGGRSGKTASRSRATPSAPASRQRRSAPQQAAIR